MPTASGECIAISGTSVKVNIGVGGTCAAVSTGFASMAGVSASTSAATAVPSVHAAGVSAAESAGAGAASLAGGGVAAAVSDGVGAPSISIGGEAETATAAAVVVAAVESAAKRGFNPMEREVTATIFGPVDAPCAGPPWDVRAFGKGSIHVFDMPGSPSSGFVGTIEESNVNQPGVGKRENITSIPFLYQCKNPVYVRVHCTEITGGKVAAVYHGIREN